MAVRIRKVTRVSYPTYIYPTHVIPIHRAFHPVLLRAAALEGEVAWVSLHTTIQYVLGHVRNSPELSI